VPESYPRYWQRLGIDAVWLVALQHHLDDFTPAGCLGSPYACNNL
jgi:hypothetical protein